MSRPLLYSVMAKALVENAKQNQTLSLCLPIAKQEVGAGNRPRVFSSFDSTNMFDYFCSAFYTPKMSQRAAFLARLYSGTVFMNARVNIFSHRHYSYGAE